MATVRVCDRCMSATIDDATAQKVSLSLGNGANEPYMIDGELCGECADIVRNLVTKMKLGPDAVPGGVRKGRRRTKVEVEQ